MSDYIDREYLVDHIHACMENDRLMRTATKEEILQMVADVPPAQPQRIEGRWIDVTKTGGAELWKCSECGELELEDSYFCPNCGADMRGDEDVGKSCTD